MMWSEQALLALSRRQRTCRGPPVRITEQKRPGSARDRWVQWNRTEPFRPELHAELGIRR